MDSYTQMKALWNTLTNEQKISLYEDVFADDYTECVEDSYEYDNGLLVISYYDKLTDENPQEKEHFCIDLNSVNHFVEAVGGYRISF